MKKSSGPKALVRQKRPQLSAVVAAKLEQAFAHHQRGQLEQAESLYRAALAEMPTHGNVLHLLGLVKYQKAEYQAALELFGTAIKADPKQAAAHSNLALVLQHLRQTMERADGFVGMPKVSLELLGPVERSTTRSASSGCYNPLVNLEEMLRPHFGETSCVGLLKNSVVT